MLNRLVDFFSGLPLRVDRPIVLLALLLLPVLWWIAYRSLLELPRAQRLLVNLARTLLVAAIVLALCGIEHVTYRKSLALAFLIDVSGSVDPAQVETIRSNIEEFSAASPETPMSVISFSGEPLAAQPDPESGLVLPQTGSPDATNIQNALQLAYGLLPTGYTRRVALFTDGNETAGDALAEAAIAASTGIEISTFPMSHAGEGEIIVEGLELPSDIISGERLNLKAAVRSTIATESTIKLSLDGRVVSSKKVPLHAGLNQVSFTVRPGKPGLRRFSLDCESAGDSSDRNNRIEQYLVVRRKPKALLLHDNGSSSTVMTAAMKGEHYRLETRSFNRFPNTHKELETFDAVVINEVPFERIPKEVVDGIDRYVKDFGGGLIVITGDENSELGGEKTFPLEKILPLDFFQRKKKEQIPAALMLVIDKSASMGRSMKFQMALKASSDMVDHIEEENRLGVLLFDDFPYWVHPLGPIPTSADLKATIETLSPEGGTAMYPAMNKAIEALIAVDTPIKHMIVLSDGESQGHFEGNLHIIREAVEETITISTVALGEDADQEVMEKIAEMGGGNYYFTDDPNNIPQIFIKEAKRIRKTTVMERTFQASRVKETAVTKGIDFEATPPLKGYLTSKPLPTSEVLVITDQREPLLASWRYGLGKVTVFTSDAADHWADGWASWDGLARLWRQALEDVLRRTDVETIDVGSQLSGDEVTVKVDTVDRFGEFTNELDLWATLIDPAGRKTRFPLEQSSPGGYKGIAPVEEYGPYLTTVTMKSRTGNPISGFDRIARPFPAEYAMAEPNLKILNEIAMMTGGEFAGSLSRFVRPGQNEVAETSPLWPWFIYFALGLILFDVLLRRI